VNSANHGPYGDAVTQELIPHVEKTYRGVGKPHARVLDGASTGGWVSLALQVFYPDFFDGAWSHCPDPVDFRAFQLMNVYADASAYVNRHGFDRPGARDLSGETRYTMRSEVGREAVLGRGGRWALSGKDWGSWNAVFSPKGDDGLPVPLWDHATGKIDAKVADHWKKYDLRLHLEKNKAALAPKLRGKLRVWVGDADEYFLNNAVYLLDDFFKEAKPSFDAKVRYGRREGHDWRGLTEAGLMAQMAEVMK
jgi:S-formylglutathione hydrolase FrmB